MKRVELAGLGKQVILSIFLLSIYLVAPALEAKGETVLYVRPFDGKNFGPVSATQTVSGGDGWRGWSWNGSTASYVAVR